MEAPEYQVGAHFEALDEGVLVAALKSTGFFSPFQFSLMFGVGQPPQVKSENQLGSVQKLNTSDDSVILIH